MEESWSRTLSALPPWSPLPSPQSRWRSPPLLHSRAVVLLQDRQGARAVSGAGGKAGGGRHDEVKGRRRNWNRGRSESWSRPKVVLVVLTVIEIVVAESTAQLSPARTWLISACSDCRKKHNYCFSCIECRVKVAIQALLNSRSCCVHIIVMTCSNWEPYINIITNIDKFYSLRGSVSPFSLFPTSLNFCTMAV